METILIIAGIAGLFYLGIQLEQRTKDKIE